MLHIMPPQAAAADLQALVDLEHLEQVMAVQAQRLVQMQLLIPAQAEAAEARAVLVLNL
jgi:hypothetical protein